MENVAAKNNMEQTVSLATNKISKQQTNEIIPISLNLHGNLSDFINYLNEIESFDYYINFESIEIGNESNARNKSFVRQAEEEVLETSAGKNKLNFKINGITYWQSH